MPVPDHEIIVAGAGPAGSVAAAFLAQAGRDVILIDQSGFPRDKPCGDVVNPFALRILFELGLKNSITDAGFYPVTAGRIVSPCGQEMLIRFQESQVDPGDTFIAPRLRLDGLVQSRAMQLGAAFIQAKILDVEYPDGQVVKIHVRDDRVEKTISCSLLLAADGSNSIVSQKLNGQYPSNYMAVAARAYVKGIQIRENTIEGFLDPSLWPGYGWLFPTGPDEANIGVGLSLKAFRHDGDSLKKIFRTFLSTPQIQSRLSPDTQVRSFVSWPLRLGWARNFRRVWDRILLLGDAAGLINPLTGGGIANAIFSGKVAAETSVDALDRNDLSGRFLSVYESRLRKIVRRELIQSEWLRRIIYTSPCLINGSVRFLRKYPLLPAMLSRLYPDLQFSIF